MSTKLLGCEGHLHTRLSARDHYTSSTLIGGKGRATPSSRHTTLEVPREYTCEMQDGCEVCMDFYMVSSGSCFTVTYIVFRNHCLEVGLTQNRQTMAL
jgi:hypothetical protein